MRPRARMVSRLTLTAAVGLAAFAAVVVADQNAKTVAAFERYVQLTEARMTLEINGASPYLWVDRQPDRRRATLQAELGRGQVVSERLETRDGPKKIDVHDGLIHHWIGTVLLRGATLERVVPFVQDYERYPELFKPIIQRATVLTRSPERFDVAMRTWARHYGVTVVIDADYGIDYRRLTPTRLYTKSVARNLFQIDEAGTAAERRIPVEKSKGYLYRLNTYCSFDERPEGTYEQCESVSLTADAPIFIGPIIRALTNGIPRDTLEFTLGQVRDGLKK